MHRFWLLMHAYYLSMHMQRPCSSYELMIIDNVAIDVLILVTNTRIMSFHTCKDVLLVSHESRDILVSKAQCGLFLQHGQKEPVHAKIKIKGIFHAGFPIFVTVLSPQQFLHGYC